MISGLAAAQPVEMADGLRANGKIYIVVIIAAMVISITGMYIISIDRKLTRLEKKISNK
jgi:hypothetical protein